jgi:hypothetical protein
VVINIKQCTKCKEYKPATAEYFYKQKKSSKKRGTFYTLTSWCKECTLIKQKRYQQENKERQSEYIKNYYPNNKEKFSYKFKDKKKFKAYQREYRQSDQGKEVYRKHGEKRRKEKTHEISTNEWLACKEYFNWSCAYCDMTYEEHQETYKEDLHKEHVGHDGSNKLDNCIPSCKSCNSSKHNKELSDWYNEDNEKYSFKREVKINKWLQEDWMIYKE